MADRAENIIGKQYGDLVILEEVQPKIFPSGQRIRRYLCKCACGLVFEASKATITKNQCCSNCSARKKRLSVFLKRLSDTDPSIEYISGFTDYKHAVVCKCTQCGMLWDNMTPDVLVRKTSSSKCPHCGKIERIEKSTLTQEEFERLVAEKNPRIIITGKYTKARNPIEFRCTACNSDQTVVRAEVLTSVENYCPICNKKYRYNTKSFIERVSIVNPYVEILGEYLSNSQRIKCRCTLCGHVWNPIADQIMQGHGCPECNITGTSFAEQVILWAFRAIYGYDAVFHRNREAIGLELDIYIPSLKLAIEPGGWHWHNQSYQRDMSKYNLCKEKGIRCITIYDQVYSDISNEYPYDDFWFYDVDLGKNYDKLKSVINRIMSDVVGTKTILSNDDWTKIFAKAKDQNIKRHDDFMLKFKEKNKNSNTIRVKSIYFRNTDPLECECEVCGYGKNGEWVTTGHALLRGRGCPFCAGQIIIPGKNDLETVNPTLAKEWNYEKNNGLTPMDVRPNSHKIVYWKCSQGHEYQMSIKDRNRGRKCTECAKARLKKP